MVKCKLNEYLESCGKSMYWLSKSSGVSFNAISDLCKNKTQRITFDMISKLCSTLDCKIEDILEFVKDNSEN